MPTIHLTDKSIKNLPTPEKGRVRYYAKTPSGFGVWKTSNGVVTFFLRYRVNGATERMYKIGQYPEWSVLTAQREAEKLKVQVDQGIDPQDRRNNERNAPTYEELWTEYEKEVLSLKSPRAQDDEKSMMRTYISPMLGRKRIKDIDCFDIARLHRQISELGKLYRANRVLEVVRSSLNLGIRLKWISSNPAIGFRKNQENPRERYLSEEELQLLQKPLMRMRIRNRQTSCAFCL